MGLILLLDGNKSAPHAISALKRRQCRSRTSVSRPNVESEDVEGPTKDCSPSCVCICPNTAHPSSGTQADTTVAKRPHRGYTLQIELMATLGLVAQHQRAEAGRPTILVICRAAGAKAIWLTSASFRKLCDERIAGRPHFWKLNGTFLR